MIVKVETGGVMFSDLTYPLESGNNKPYLLVKTTAKKDFINSNIVVINLTIIYRFENKGSNKIIDVLKSQSKYRITIKYLVTIEELYIKVYLHAMEYFIKAFKEMDKMDKNENNLLIEDLEPLSINDLKGDLVDLCEKILNIE
jgi:hypothetical protein